MDHPQKVTCAFAKALSAAELDRAISLFADDGCFVTPDATTVYGRHGVRAILAQLIAGHAQLRVAPKSLHIAGSMALCSERWVFTYACKDVSPFTQAAGSTVLLRRSNRVWELLFVAPWHIVDADRSPLLRCLGPDKGL
jgi:ketosteroid isomerase-like protein